MLKLRLHISLSIAWGGSLQDPFDWGEKWEMENMREN